MVGVSYRVLWELRGEHLTQRGIQGIREDSLEEATSKLSQRERERERASDLFSSNCRLWGMELSGHVSSKIPGGGGNLVFSENSSEFSKVGAESGGM